jgi:hypothetical protein
LGKRLRRGFMSPTLLCSMTAARVERTSRAKAANFGDEVRVRRALRNLVRVLAERLRPKLLPVRAVVGHRRQVTPPNAGCAGCRERHPAAHPATQVRVAQALAGCPGCCGMFSGPSLAYACARARGRAPVRGGKNIPQHPASGGTARRRSAFFAGCRAGCRETTSRNIPQPRRRLNARNHVSRRLFGPW